MGRKEKVLYKFMIMSPLVMLLALGVESRTAQPAFEPYAYSQDVQERLLAYVEPVKSVNDDEIIDGSHFNGDAARRAAKIWVEGIESGKLKIVMSQNLFDTVREGAKRDITVKADLLISALYSDAKRSTDVERVLENSEMAIKLANHFKHWDLFGFGYFSMRERIWVEVLKNVEPELDDSQIGRVASLIPLIDSDSHLTTLLTVQAEKKYMDDGRRRGEQRLPILDPAFRLMKEQKSVLLASKAFLEPTMLSQINSVAYAHGAAKAQKVAVEELKKRLELRKASGNN